MVERIFEGSSGDDTLIGTQSDDLLSGNAGNDTLIGKGGDDEVFGGPRRDIAEFAGVMSEYRIVRDASGAVIVTDLAAHSDGDEGADRLFGVEVLAFKDRVVNVSDLFEDVTVNSAPHLQNGAFAVGEEALAGTIDLGLLANDPNDDWASLSYSLVSAPTWGIASLTGPLLTFSPNGAFEALAVGETGNSVAFDRFTNPTSADVYHGRGAKILKMREAITNKTIRPRRLQHQTAAA